MYYVIYLLSSSVVSRVQSPVCVQPLFIQYQIGCSYSVKYEGFSTDSVLQASHYWRPELPRCCDSSVTDQLLLEILVTVYDFCSSPQLLCEACHFTFPV